MTNSASGISARSIILVNVPGVQETLPSMQSARRFRLDHGDLNIKGAFSAQARSNVIGKTKGGKM
jgi:hypothetical protein